MGWKFGVWFTEFGPLSIREHPAVYVARWPLLVVREMRHAERRTAIWVVAQCGVSYTWETSR